MEAVSLVPDVNSDLIRFCLCFIVPVLREGSASTADMLVYLVCAELSECAW